MTDAEEHSTVRGSGRGEGEGEVQAGERVSERFRQICGDSEMGKQV